MKLTKMMFVVWALLFSGFVAAVPLRFTMDKPEANAVSALLSPASGQMNRQDERPGQLSLVAVGANSYQGTFFTYDEAGAQLWLEFHGKFFHASEQDVLEGKHLGSMEAGLFYAPDGQRLGERFRYGTINVIWQTPTTAVVRVQQGDQKPDRPALYAMTPKTDSQVRRVGSVRSKQSGAPIGMRQGPLGSTLVGPLEMIDLTMRVRVEHEDGSIQVLGGVTHFTRADVSNLYPFLDEDQDHEIYNLNCWDWGNCDNALMPLLFDGMDCFGSVTCKVVLFWNRATGSGTIEAMKRSEWDDGSWQREKKAVTGVLMSTTPGSAFPMAGVGRIVGDKAISYELVPLPGSTGWFKEDLPVIEGLIINSMSTSNGG